MRRRTVTLKHKMLTLMVLGVTVGAVAVGAAVATPGSGIVGAPILARGTLDGHSKIKVRNSSKPRDVVVQQVTLAPGGTTGWHTHPGPAVVIVKSGSITLYESHDHEADDHEGEDDHEGDDHEGDDPTCTSKTYAADPANPAGKVFVDAGYGHVHFGRNEGSTNTELYVTYLDVPVGGAPRLDAPNPGGCDV